MNYSGIVMNSYYSTKNGSDAYVDVLVRNGGESKQFAKVPILKNGGLSFSLPPVGATAIIGFIGEGDTSPFMIGFIDSETSRKVSSDDKAPRKPPTTLTR